MNLQLSSLYPDKQNMLYSFSPTRISMKKRLMMKQIIYTLLISLVLFSSCTMKNSVLLEKDGSGELSFELDLAPYLGEVIEQVQTLMEGDVPETGDSFFDLEAIRAGFESNEDVVLKTLESPHELSLRGSFSFNRVESMLQKMEEGSAGEKMITFSQSGGVSRMDLKLNRETVNTLMSENEAFDNPLTQSFGPSSTEGMSRSDYLDMMEFAMGEESRMGISDSRLNVTVRTSGKITEQKGGTLIDSNTVRFDIPLLDLLMLETPLQYSLSYR